MNMFYNAFEITNTTHKKI